MDEQFEALSHPARRQLLLALYRERPDDGGKITVTDEVSDVSEVELYHRHLPKLQEVGLVRYNGDRTRVTAGPAFDDVEWLLQTMVEQSPAPRSRLGSSRQ